MNSNTQPIEQGAPPDPKRRTGYPHDLVDLCRLNQIVRHRVRNLCGGCQMVLDVLRTSTKAENSAALNWNSMYGELTNIQDFSRRLDWMLDPLPPEEGREFVAVLEEVQQWIRERYPLCSATFSGPEDPFVLEGGNWYAILFRELLDNAAQAAGTDGIVEVAWTTSPRLQIVIGNNGQKMADSIPLSPPIPFKTTHPSRDGLGLSIVQRLCYAMDIELKFRTDLSDMTAVVLTERRVNEKEA